MVVALRIGKIQLRLSNGAALVVLEVLVHVALLLYLGLVFVIIAFTVLDLGNVVFLKLVLLLLLQRSQSKLFHLLIQVVLL